MNRFLTLIHQDLLLSWRNYLIAGTGVLLLVMIAFVYLLPESLSVPADEFVYDASADKAFENFLRTQGAEDTNFVSSEAELASALEASSRGVGIVYTGAMPDPTFRLLTVGRIAEENVNLIGATMASLAASMQDRPGPDNYQVQTLRPPGDPVPVNLSFIPIAVVFEVVLLGFMFGAVMIFQEKQEGVNRAFRVSPATTLDYIGSKNVLFIALSLLYGGLLLLAAFQFTIPYAPILLLIVLSTSLMTLIGLAIAVFFHSLSDWFFVGIAVLVVNMLPVISYALPTFSPDWLALIPSYPVLFGVRELLFPTGREGFLLPTILLLLAYNAVAFLLCYLAVDRRLMKAG